MEIKIQIIIFWVLLADSLIANAIAWFGQKWYMRHFQIMSRIFPLTRAWTFLYLLLVLWAGILLGIF